MCLVGRIESGKTENQCMFHLFGRKEKWVKKKTIMICNNLLIFKVKNTILEIYDKNFNNPHISYNSSII